MTGIELFYIVIDVSHFVYHPINTLALLALYCFFSTVFRRRGLKKHPHDRPGGSGGSMSPDGGGGDLGGGGDFGVGGDGGI